MDDGLSVVEVPVRPGKHSCGKTDERRSLISTSTDSNTCALQQAASYIVSDGSRACAKTHIYSLFGCFTVQMYPLSQAYIDL